MGKQVRFAMARSASCMSIVIHTDTSLHFGFLVRTLGASYGSLAYIIRKWGVLIAKILQ